PGLSIDAQPAPAHAGQGRYDPGELGSHRPTSVSPTRMTSPGWYVPDHASGASLRGFRRLTRSGIHSVGLGKSGRGEADERVPQGGRLLNAEEALEAFMRLGPEFRRLLQSGLPGLGQHNPPPAPIAVV